MIIDETTINGDLLFQFDSFSHWVNKATSLYAEYAKGKQTIAFDTAGNICRCGAEMMNARDNKLFPVKVYGINKKK